MTQSVISSLSKQQSQPHANTRALAQLFKLDIADMFNAWNEEKPLRTGMPHASAILAPEADFCLRRLVLSALYPEQTQRPAKKPWDARQNAVFLNGWGLHEKYQNLFQRFGSVLESETSHYDEDRLLHFTPDAIIEHQGETMVVEIKGYKTEHFDKLDEDGAPSEAAHHQANLYMHLLKLKYALILVENKNTQNFKVWCVEYNRELVLPYLDRIYKFKGALVKAHSGELPPARVCTAPGDSRAQKCAMCTCCFKQDEGW